MLHDFKRMFDRFVGARCCMVNVLLSYGIEEFKCVSETFEFVLVMGVLGFQLKQLEKIICSKAIVNPMTLIEIAAWFIFIGVELSSLSMKIILSTSILLEFNWNFSLFMLLKTENWLGQFRHTSGPVVNTNAHQPSRRSRLESPNVKLKRWIIYI